MVRAKFRVDSVTPDEYGNVNVSLSAVIDGSPENEEFWKATPSGTITMSISNPEAAEVFKPTMQFYVDFTEVIHDMP